MAGCSRQQRKIGIWKWALVSHVFEFLAGLGEGMLYYRNMDHNRVEKALSEYKHRL
jgi:hypothetical protein